MKLLVFICVLCDLIFVPLLLTLSDGHKINVIFLHEGEEVDRWWFYEPLEGLNLSADPTKRFKRRPGIKAIHIGAKAKCVKNKKQEQYQFAKVVPRYGTAHLPCRICKQSDEEAMEAKTWFRWTKELEKGGDEVVWKPEEVRLDMHDQEEFNRVYTKLDHTLVIKDFRPSDVGTYYCEKYSKKALHTKYSFKLPGEEGEEGAVNFALIYKRLVGRPDVDFLYHVDIETQLEGLDSNVVSLNTTGLKPPRKNITSKKDNWVVYTEWGEWSECSQCRQPGEKKRDGVCMVRKLNATEKSSPEFIDKVLTLYEEGAPCHSSLFHKHEKFHNLPKESQVEKCLIACTITNRHDVFQTAKGANESAVVKDFQRKVRFDVNVSSQSGSMLGSALKKKLEGLKKPVKKMFKEGQKAKLVCITKKDKTLKWYRNNTLLLNTELAKNESYRIKISAKGYLKFARVKPKDNGLYKCTFSKGKKKRQWIVTVKKKINPNYGYYYGMLLVSYIAMFGVFLVALCCRTSYLITTKRKNFHKEKEKKAKKEKEKKKKKGLFGKKKKQEEASASSSED